MNNEIWKVIPLYPNYEASNTGKIRRLLNGKELKQAGSDIRNYQVVTLFTNGKKYNKKVARLVYQAFNGCECEFTIDHIDRNKLNNNLDNLRCITNRENCQNRTIYKTKNKYNLSKQDKINIVLAYDNGEKSSWKLSREYKVPPNYLLTTLKRGTWHKLCQEQQNQDTENISQ
jgi:hypothetical protein